MPKKVKDLLQDLAIKVEKKSCVEVSDVQELLKRVTWTNLPTIVDDALELLAVNTGRTSKTLPNWINLPSSIEALELQIVNLDCRKIAPALEKEVEEQETVETIIEEQVEEVKITQEEVIEDKVNISKIKLIEFDSEEDLTGTNEEVNITVYFEDKSGDEVPNVGVKLFIDKGQKKPLEGYKGAFYFTNSKSDDKVTMLVRGTGTVKKTKFEV